jgi:hypothetical protein
LTRPRPITDIATPSALYRLLQVEQQQISTPNGSALPRAVQHINER